MFKDRPTLHHTTTHCSLPWYNRYGWLGIEFQWSVSIMVTPPSHFYDVLVSHRSTMHCWIIPQLRRALLNHSTPWCVLGYVTPLHSPHTHTPQSIVKAPPHSTMHCWSITPLHNALVMHHPTSQCIVEATPHYTMPCRSTTLIHSTLLKHRPSPHYTVSATPHSTMQMWKPLPLPSPCWSITLLHNALLKAPTSMLYC